MPEICHRFFALSSLCRQCFRRSFFSRGQGNRSKGRDQADEPVQTAASRSTGGRNRSRASTAARQHCQLHRGLPDRWTTVGLSAVGRYGATRRRFATSGCRQNCSARRSDRRSDSQLRSSVGLPALKRTAFCSFASFFLHISTCVSVMATGLGIVQCRRSTMTR